MKLLFAVVTFALWADDSTELFTAIRQGDHVAVARLIGKGADVNAPRADGATPLLQAVLTSDARMLKLLVEKGADVKGRSAQGLTALHAAVYDPRLTKLLLDAGADPNAALADGKTPLFGAVVRGGSSPVLDLLIQHGASVDAKRTAAGGILAHAAGDELLEIARHSGSRFADRLGFLLDDGGERGHGSLAVKGAVAGDHLV